MDAQTTFVNTEDNKHHFLFRCDGCDCLGTLEIPADTKRFSCPEDCGAQYVLWFDTLISQPAIKCVVCPVFAEDDDDEDDADDCAYCNEWERCTCFD